MTLTYSSIKYDRHSIVKEVILAEIGKGLDDKQVIYSKVVETLGVPRPTVRRVARELRDELLEVIKILQSDIPKPTFGEDLK